MRNVRTKLKKKRRDRNRVSPTSLTTRSKVTNGTTLDPAIDGRSAYARRIKDLIREHSNDLGGDANISQGQRALIRRAAFLQAELEKREVKFANNAGASRIALDHYQKAINTLRRVLLDLGLDRQNAAMRIITPDSTNTDDIDTTEYEKTFGGEGMQFVLIDGHKVFFVMNAGTANETIKRMAHLEEDFSFIERLRGQQQGEL